jgi:cell division protein FtsB
MLRNFSLSIIIILIAFFTVFGRNDLPELMKFQLQYNRRNEKLSVLNSAIIKEQDTMYGLTNSPEYLEQISREDTELSKSGEIIYIFGPLSDKSALEKISP